METDKGLDKAAPSTEKGDDQPAAVAQAGSAVNMDDPHPPPPPQLTALQQTPDQNQQQQVTNRQFLQDLYSARQKLQSPQPQSPQPQ
jgi:streptomycin 6-kinase